jgi:uncharacterized protein (TIRG00374 family)
MKKLWIWIRLAVSAGLIAILVFTIDFSDLNETLRRADAGFLLLAVFWALCDRVMMAYKWNILLRVKSIQIPLLNITGTYLTSTFLGVFLPATVGGDAIRAYAVSKEGHRSGDVISSIILERLLGTAALFIFVLASIILSISVFGERFFDNIWHLFWLVLGLLAALSILIWISLSQRLVKRGVAWIRQRNEKLVENKIARKLQEGYSSYLSYRDDRLELGVFLVLSMIENFFPILMNYSLSLAFGMEIPLLYFFILTPIVLVLVRLPISIDGIGIQEGAFVYFLTLIAVPRSEALLLGVASHILAILSILPGGILYGISGLNLRDKSREEPAAPRQD